MKKNTTVILLFILLVILCLLQILIEGISSPAFSVINETPEEYTAGIANDADDDIPQDVYDVTGYIFKNSSDYMERLRTEVNNLANDKTDREHLYEVAESIRLNQISYYTTLNDAYAYDNYELVETCKTCVFNTEALAYNIMSYIRTGKTGYISRAMICISADSAASYKFRLAQENYRAAHEDTPERGTDGR